MAFNAAQRNAEYEIAILCALSLEATAVRGVFDEIYEDAGRLRKASSDKLAYTTGRIGRHKVVLGHMARMGKTHAAVSAQSLLASFGGLKLVLLVGICGGVPSKSHDGRPDMVLGDVVIGKNVVQMDLGSQYPDRFARKEGIEDNLGPQRVEVRAFVEKLESCKSRFEETTVQRLATLLQKPGFEQSTYPGVERDRLFTPKYAHKHNDDQACKCAGSSDICEDARHASCEQLGCDTRYLMSRGSRERIFQQPAIHFGSIASGDTVMKSGKHRDNIAEKDGVIAFKMEGAGIWDSLPCVIVKGVSDYADSHKDKQWQPYAAAVAAACAVAAIEEWDATGGQATSQVVQTNTWNNDGNTKVMHQAGYMNFSGNQTFNM
ncbi:purine and uridine phosphorylase [Aspergillus pseudoustus]|uniref:Purine and uridine phosphorylase n=1 Tax=Aspergillus pseudoustus TaxID=1810923 RepID=A0ABR4JEU0_9EURO